MRKAKVIEANNFTICFLIIALITSLKIYYLSLNQFNLFFDEAQYWSWSKTFALGYYSKPPMVAWLINLTTSLCGEDEFCVRLSSPIVHAITSIVIYFIAKELYDRKVAIYSAITYLTLPAVTVSSAIISTDPSLLMFWAFATLCFIKAIKYENLFWWVFAGIFGGLGMLSKYNMLIFLVSTFLYLAASQAHRKVFKSFGLWLCLSIAGLVFLPNVVWNLQNGFVSFGHTKDNADIAGFAIHPDNMLSFLGAQLGVFGPILFSSLIYLIVRINRLWQREEGKMLIIYILPMLLAITGISLLSRAHANWAAPIYVPATVLVVGWMIRSNREKLLYASLALHIFIAVVVANFNFITKIPSISLSGIKTNISEGKIKDPFKRLRGWKELGEGVTMMLNSYPDAQLLTDSRKIHSELLYYVNPHPFDAIKWNPTGRRGDHFEMMTDINKTEKKNFIFVTTASSITGMESYFEESMKVGNISVSPYEDAPIDYYIYYLIGFKGYGQADVKPE